MSEVSLYSPLATPELEEHRAKVREFAEKELAPLRQKYEEENLDGLGKVFPWDIYRKLGERGLLAEHVPKEYGGRGESFLTEVVTIEEIARVCGTFSVLVDYTPTLVCNPILMYGTEEQKKKYLPPILRGEKVGSYALTEPKWGSDVASIETTAVKKGGEYVINGHKKFIMLGNIADILLVFAKTAPEAKARGITVFIVERGTEGVSYPKQEKKMGLKATPTSEIKFENVAVPEENILGGPSQLNKGIYVALDALDHGRCGVAAQAVGVAQSCLEQAIAYSGRREQFGKKIAEFQAIQWMIADMATKIDAARLLTYRAAYLRDLAIRGKISRRMVTLPASMAKCYATEVATWAAHRAIQVFGGRGFMMDEEYTPIKALPTPEKAYRDCRIFEIYEGTNEIQRMVIFRELFRKYSK
ncbi:MAG: acyl-CoA dehydrogenase [Thermoproteota archaeon]|nr:MAG: acyl-CoA dehydrogenase [Candidatus Korarchaeota archaeon]RLG52350.1 MAG: acyl-CoA dehydrogenase [Candidatus Korarchaeota archaeon]